MGEFAAAKKIWPNESGGGDSATAKFEAGAGIEPANRGFADPDLTTWLPRRLKANGRLGAPHRRVNAAALSPNSALDVGRWALDVFPLTDVFSFTRTFSGRAKLHPRRR